MKYVVQMEVEVTVTVEVGPDAADPETVAEEIALAWFDTHPIENVKWGDMTCTETEPAPEDH